MIGIIFSSELAMAKKAAMGEIKKSFPVRDEGSFASFSLSLTPLKEIIEEASFMSLTSERKAILVQDCLFLSKSKAKKKGKEEDENAILLDYLKAPNPDCDLYLLVPSDSLDIKNPCVAKIKEMPDCFIKEVKMPSYEEWVYQIKKYFEKRGGQIEQIAAEELGKRIDGDYAKFVNECQKLYLYAEGKRINRSDVITLTYPKEEEDAFAISNALMEKDNARALSIYKDLKKHGVEEIRLLNLLAKEFFYLDQVNFLDGLGKSENEIASQLGGSPYRVRFAKKKLRFLNQDKLSSILEDLYKCELSILRGEVGPNFAFELFLANFKI